MRVEGSKEKSVILNGSLSLKEEDLQLHLEVRGLKQQVDILNIFYGYFFIIFLYKGSVPANLCNSSRVVAFSPCQS